LQFLQQAAQVAVDADSIIQTAVKLKKACQHNTADIWIDGSLGSNDGLPDRKTRIYIAAAMANKRKATATEKSQIGVPGQPPACVSAATSDGVQPVKKKRKGKSERNRLKKEAAMQQTDAQTPTA